MKQVITFMTDDDNGDCDKSGVVMYIINQLQ